MELGEIAGYAMVFVICAFMLCAIIYPFLTQSKNGTK